MAARSGMSNLIQRLRAMCDAGTAEWTTNAIAYWSDDLLEDHLDLHRVAYVETVAPIGVGVDGSTEYHDYKLAFGQLEELGSGTAVWSVRSAAGTLQGTATYTPNYEAGQVNFSADTEGSVFTFRYRTFDLYAAAADVWRMRAANVFKYYAVREGEHSLSRNQMFEHCFKMAAQMDKQSGGAGNMTVRMFRSDLNV